MAGTGGVSSSMVPTLPAQAQPGRKSCGDLMTAVDWAATALGPRSRWDPAVAATVELVLASPMPMAFCFGDDFVLLYNDAYADLIGALHPAALGRPAAEAFGELWPSPGFGGVIEDVYHSGQPFLEAETQLTVARTEGGHPEQAFLTRGHSAVRDSAGTVAGVL